MNRDNPVETLSRLLDESGATISFSVNCISGLVGQSNCMCWRCMKTRGEESTEETEALAAERSKWEKSWHHQRQLEWIRNWNITEQQFLASVRNTRACEISMKYLADRVTKKNVPYFNHVEEGLVILSHLKVPVTAGEAYILHPLFQSNDELRTHRSWLMNGHLSTDVVFYLMEYRNIANRGIRSEWNKTGKIELSPVWAVNQMLVADKVQNRKDFRKYNSDHPEAQNLEKYFSAWLEALSISEDRYNYLIQKL